MVPYDPIQVLSQLHKETKTLTPPSSSHGSYSSSSTPKTPRTLRQFECQSRTVEKYLKRRTTSPESPAKQALRTANQKQRQKRSKPALSISQRGIMTVREGELRTQSLRNVEERGEDQSVTQPKTKAPSRCSVCSSYEHTARTCAIRYGTN